MTNNNKNNGNRDNNAEKESPIVAEKESKLEVDNDEDITRVAENKKIADQEKQHAQFAHVSSPGMIKKSPTDLIRILCRVNVEPPPIVGSYDFRRIHGKFTEGKRTNPDGSPLLVPRYIAQHLQECEVATILG